MIKRMNQKKKKSIEHFYEVPCYKSTFCRVNLTEFGWSDAQYPLFVASECSKNNKCNKKNV